jgi:SAM-dependent methyltransferase
MTREGYETRVRDRQRSEWAAVAPGWRRNRERLGVTASPITERLISLSGVDRGYRVLDMACGTGDPAFTLAENVGPEGYVLGLDLSDEMVRASRAWAGSQGIDNVEFRAIRSELEPGVEPRTFDAATCRHGLQFMPDPMAALQELSRAVKSGGKIAASTWTTPERNPNFTLPKEIMARHADLPEEDPTAPGLFAIPTPGDLELLFETAGLTRIHTEVFPTPIARANSAESYWHSIETVAGPLVSLLASFTDEQRRDIREDAIHTLREMFPDGPVEIDGEAIAAVGVSPG